MHTGYKQTKKEKKNLCHLSISLDTLSIHSSHGAIRENFEDNTSKPASISINS